MIVVGCSHPGIDKIVEAAAKINPRIHLVAGGFHLVVSKDEEIEKDRYRPARHVQSRRTSRPATAPASRPSPALRKSFGDRYLYAGLGTSLTLGATPRAIAGAGQDAPAAMNEDDLKSYRTLLANSDDHEHSLLAHDAH